MLVKEKPDVVSICTWPKLHAEMAVACAQAGVKMCHCEKPMDLTFGGSRKMLQVAAQHGMQLNFNHQRRYGKPFRETRELIDSGEVGRASMHALRGTGWRRVWPVPRASMHALPSRRRAPRPIQGEHNAPKDIGSLFFQRWRRQAKGNPAAEYSISNTQYSMSK